MYRQDFSIEVFAAAAVREWLQGLAAG
ncbi:hypothetical protein HaLaN_10807, partial [Haematococcus lacustris]